MGQDQSPVLLLLWPRLALMHTIRILTTIPINPEVGGNKDKAYRYSCSYYTTMLKSFLKVIPLALNCLFIQDGGEKC
jgi:hypothetical protein